MGFHCAGQSSGDIVPPVFESSTCFARGGGANHLDVAELAQAPQPVDELREFRQRHEVGGALGAVPCGVAREGRAVAEEAGRRRPPGEVLAVVVPDVLPGLRLLWGPGGEEDPLPIVGESLQRALGERRVPSFVVPRGPVIRLDLAEAAEEGSEGPSTLVVHVLRPRRRDSFEDQGAAREELRAQIANLRVGEAGEAFGGVDCDAHEFAAPRTLR